MHLTFTLVKSAHLRFQAHREASRIAEVVGSLSGVSPLTLSELSTEADLLRAMDQGQSPILLLTPAELLGNGTVCGFSGNTCFNKEVINFLEKHQTKEIFTTVIYLPEEGFQLLGGYLKIKAKPAEQLSNLVEQAGGSWRFDSVDDYDYAAFETE